MKLGLKFGVIVRLVYLAIVCISLIACQERASTDQPLVIATADGHYLYVQCLKQNGLNSRSLAGCQYQPAGRDWYNTYYSSSAVPTTPYVIYPPNYAQNNLCSYYGWSGDCYQAFNYPTESYDTIYQYQFQWEYNYNGCNSCLGSPFDMSCLSGESFSCVYPMPTTPTTPAPTPTPLPKPKPQPAPAPKPKPVPQPKSATPSTVRVPCVGGPNHPSYAFWTIDAANRCEMRVAGFSKACQTDVQVRYCTTTPQLVAITDAVNCVCAPASGAIGTW